MTPALFRLALVLGALSAVSPFAIDMFLPGLPTIARDLGVTDGAAQLTLTGYFIAFGLSQMIYGPLADLWGRRPPLMLGLAIFIAGSALAAVAPGLPMLVAARVLQGIGGGAMGVVPRAVVRDRATGPDGTRMMAAIMVVIAVSPLLAPLAGSAVIAMASWRAVFGILGLAAVGSLLLVLFVLPETLDPANRRPLNLGAMGAGIRRLLGSRRFVGLTMIGAFGFSSFFVFIAGASFIYTGFYGLTPTQFSLAFAVNAIGFFAASQTAGRLGQTLGMERTIALGTTGFAVGVILLGLIGPLHPPLWVLMAALFLSFACLGVVMPTTMVLALDPHPDLAGLASSLGGAIQMLTAAAIGSIAGLFFDGTPGPMLAGIAVCGALTWGAAFLTLPRLSLRP